MRDILVFDVETQKSFADIGGQNSEDRFGELGISVLGVYSYTYGKFLAFREHEMQGFEELLKHTDLLVGFNSKRFDVPVIQPHLEVVDMRTIPHLDILEEVVEVLGRRLKLDNLVKATLGEGKSGSGLEALDLWKDGRMTELTRYCIDDVRLTRDLYAYGEKHHSVKFVGKDGTTVYTLPVNWGLKNLTVETYPELFSHAAREGWQMRVCYEETNVLFGSGEPQELVLDVYAVGDGVLEAFSHTHNTRKIFAIPKISHPHFTGQQYKVPGNYKRQI
ncbi:MAG: hypothetical protein COT39_00540 [Parcubacteria group bacterium CG08_land_8_20_14_0_20_48_21]|nr:MAG: hypothetical protein COT39_00540 [Parcubacteria group bacterium CG08_land_8_20_14_0_20_48_21]PIW79395.1 MAG: hypothetical protein COZ99_01065 [Parcubacteria group bacterium CG_4_8_14_3_um_filter_48_16]PIY77655.1 MAG: hypothetical protein COY83_03890 [Parcubacteria group bacterium CG_4_10_14_0_8_um_filter_48_154]PIZ77431.1 MAG: hypothetical protein COY03_02750 [bacterium CG_4_10_14_0_2_um_filter_48_144]